MIQPRSPPTAPDYKPPEPSSRSTSLYVGGLDPTVTESMLFEIFNMIGPVAGIRVCRDAVTRRSLGYAYVNYLNPGDGERALGLDYSLIKNQPCRIMWALPQTSLSDASVENQDNRVDNEALQAACANAQGSTSVMQEKQSSNIDMACHDLITLSSHLPTNTDVVSLSALHLAATIGPDHWHRTRPQPMSLSLQFHLSPSYLDKPGQTDNVTDSLHYGHLAKTVEQQVGAKGERRYVSARALVDDVTDAVFRFVDDTVGKDGKRVQEVVHAVRVVLELPKQILLAGGFEVELTTRASHWRSAGIPSGDPRTDAQIGLGAPGAIVRVMDLILPVLVGVNPPERLFKQRVVTHLTFFEAARTTDNTINEVDVEEIDYPAIIQQIATDIEKSTHLTLEKLVYEIIHTAYRALDTYSEPHVSRIDAITVRCQKPSALSFADASGVEMTRTREALRRVRI